MVSEGVDDLAEVVGVRFKTLGKIYYFSPEGCDIPAGEDVVVETARGLEYGKAVFGNREVDEKKVVQPLRKVVRVATQEDREKMLAARDKEGQARLVCLEKIAQRQLPMKLVEVEYSFDGSKVLFYFTSEGRVDFRELVKDLASIFKTRIELRQIGVRDEAKMLGGLGACGRELCCASFLSDFEPVSIRMAKEQNLSLNPSKISGICGRLMCCLKYESEGYECARKSKADKGQEKKSAHTESEKTDVESAGDVQADDASASEVYTEDGDSMVLPGADYVLDEEYIDNPALQGTIDEDGEST